MAGLGFSYVRSPGLGSGANVNPSTGGSTTYTPSPFNVQQQTSTPTPYAPGAAQSPFKYTPEQQAQNSQYQQTYRDALNSQITNAAPELTYNAAERARLQATQGLAAGSFADREASLRADYGANLRGLGLDQNAIDVRRGANARDAAYYQNLLGLMPYYQNLSAKELERALGSSRQQGTMERLGINSDYTSRGAFFSGMRTIKNIDSAMSEQNRNTSANIGYGRDMLGQTEKTMGLERSKAMTGDQAALLDIEAQKLGVSRDKYAASLQQGLASLGYDKFMSMSDLIGKLNSSDYQQAQLARQIIDAASAAGQAALDGTLGNAYNGYGG